jgi:hypothetical protein
VRLFTSPEVEAAGVLGVSFVGVLSESQSERKTGS